MQISFLSGLSACVVCVFIGLFIGGTFTLNRLCTRPAYSTQVATQTQTQQQFQEHPEQISESTLLTEAMNRPLTYWARIKPEYHTKLVKFVTGNDLNLDALSNCVSSSLAHAEQNNTNLQESSIKDVIILCNQELQKAIQKADDEAHPYMEAKELSEKFEANVISFKKDFAGNTLKVQGEINDFKEDLYGNAYVQLYTSMYGIRCFVNDRTSLLELQKGQRIKIQGLYKGDSTPNWYIDLSNCRIVE